MKRLRWRESQTSIPQRYVPRCWEDLRRAACSKCTASACSNGNFKPGFPARLYRKDLRIVLDALNDARAPAPVTAIVQQLLTALLARDGEALDYSALGTVAMDMARVER